MEDILQFKKIEEEHKKDVGLKAYNLAIIKKYSNVPNGFVLSKNVMEKFLKENNLIETIKRFLSSLMIDNENIIPIVNLIQKRIINAEFSKEMKEEILEFYESLSYSKSQDANQMLDKKKESLISVRNGEWSDDSNNIYQLNVIGGKKLIEAIKLEFASNFTSNKIISKKKKGMKILEIFDDSINPVIIQLMQQVQRSGIALSVNPKNNSEKEILIRAAFGLGIAKDDPNLGYDEYIIDNDYEVLDSKIGNQEYAYEKDIDSDITVKYMLKENSTKEKVNSSHLKEIGQTTKKFARILESNIILEWGFTKDKLIVFDVKPIELEKSNHEINEYSEQEIDKENVAIEEYDLLEEPDQKEAISVFEEPETSEDNLEVIEFYDEQSPDIVTIDETDSLKAEDVSEASSSKTEIIPEPILQYEEKAEGIITLDDYEDEKANLGADIEKESEFGYNFLDEPTGETPEVDDLIIQNEEPSSESENRDELIIELNDDVKDIEEKGPEPDLFINMNRPNIDEATTKISKSINEDDDFAQQLLDEDFDEPEETEEDSFQEENNKPIIFDTKEEQAEEQVSETFQDEEPSFFDMIEEVPEVDNFNTQTTESFPESENLFDEKEIILEEEQLKPEPIPQVGEPEDDTDFFSRMEVEDDGDFIFSDDKKEVPEVDNSNMQNAESSSESMQEPQVDKDVFMKQKMSSKPSLMMEKAFSEASNVVITCDAAILNSLKEKYKALFNKEPHNYFIELINELKTKTNVPYEGEIKRVRNLREKYLLDYETLSSEDITFCLNTSKKFTSEF